jgi:hypothetical protein
MGGVLGPDKEDVVPTPRHLAVLAALASVVLALLAIATLVAMNLLRPKEGER